MRRKKFLWPALVAMTAFFTMAMYSAVALASGSPSIASDQPDYSPGSVVTLTGSGWAGDTSVQLNVNDDLGKTWSWSDTVTPDANGDFTDTLTLSTNFVAQYTVTATGSPSGAVATTTFTDGALQIIGAPAQSGIVAAFTFTVHIVGYSDSGCSTNPGPGVDKTFNNSTFAAMSDEPGTRDGSNNKATSVTLSVIGTSSDGRTFDHWDTASANGVCVLNPATSNDQHTAHFGAAPPPPPSNHAPGVAANNATVTVNEGSTANNTGTWSDADSGDTVTLTASVGTITQSGTNAAGTWSWSFATTDGPDESQTVTITADDGTTTTSTTFGLTVNNVAPTVAFDSGLDTTVNEATTQHTYTYSISDPGADTVQSVSVGCGTGGTYVSDTHTNISGSITCQFLDGPASPNVTAQATDSDGAAGNSASLGVTVKNVAPTLGALTFPSSATACIGGNTATVGGISWTDPAGALDEPFSVTINWGDTSSNTYPGINAFSLADKSHIYAAGGPYTVSVTVTDKDAGTSTAATSSTFSFLYNASGVLQPVNDTQAHQDPSVFKYGSTIPVKIKVTDCNGISVSTLSPVISVKKISGSTPPTGVDETITSTSSADTTPYMRYDSTAQQYIYNLATKSLNDSSATYTITITGPFPTVTANFGTKPR
jgi:hypothetical protein